MAMEAADIERLIRLAYPTARDEITDLAGDGNHNASTVTAEEIPAMNRDRQHHLDYAAKKGKMAGSRGEQHAQALTTKAPE
jgi:acid stress-induced BolA-like protein IbaG/YrbA